MTTASCVSYGFRGRDDSVGLNTDTWTYAQNTNFSYPVDTVCRVRFGCQEVNNKSFILSWQLEYSLDNSSFTSVTTSSNYIRAVASSQFNDGDVITASLLTGDTQTWSNGEGNEDGVGTSKQMQNLSSEYEYSFQIQSADVTNGQYLYLRIYGLSVTPTSLRITVQKATATSSSKSAFTDGLLVATPSSKSAFLFGANVATPSSKHAYIGPPAGYPTSSKYAFTKGGIVVTPSSKSGYTGGSLSDLDSNTAYLVGGIVSADSQIAYMEGYQLGGPVEDSHSAFTLGLDNWLVPDSDLSSSGVWKNELDSESNIYLSIDESPTPNDSDYIWNTDPTTGYYYECTLTNPIGTPGDGDVIILWRGRDKTGSGNAQATIQLRQGAAVIGSDTQILPATPTTFYFMLTAGEKANITDWTDLRIRVIITIL